MSAPNTRESQAVRYWLTPAGCVAAGGHVGSGRCATCGADVDGGAS